MSSQVLRRTLRRVYRTALAARASELSPEELRRSAVVFAPHPDDETLGCGGAILRKTALGCPICIVFMTDGSASHGKTIGKRELKVLREEEARAACQKLGVSAENVVFLGFEDGNLGGSRGAATGQVQQVLARYQPAEVFIPCSKERPKDHFYTWQIARDAIGQLGSSLTVNEYPVWLWGRWPWISPEEMRPWTNLKLSLKTDVGYLLRRFRYSVDISTVLAEKRAALAEHRTQMERLAPDTRWSVLGDVAGGEWLELFFQPQEFFDRYRFDPQFR